jgi:hypothetical protein
VNSPNFDLNQIWRLLTTGTTAGMDGPGYTPLRRKEFKRATEQGFFTVKHEPPGMGIIWFEWCSRNSHPFLVLVLKGKYATIGLDMLSTYAETLSEAGFCAVEQRLDELKLEWSGTPSFLEITVPVADAESLAKWLLDLAVSDKCSWGSREAR